MNTSAKTDLAVAKAHIEELRMRGGEFTADSLERLVDAYQDLDERGRSAGADWVPSFDIDHPSHPGETILEQMREKRVGRFDVIDRTREADERFSEILRGERALTAPDAILIGRALDLDPRFLLRMDFSFQLSRLKKAESRVALQKSIDGIAEHAAEIREEVEPLDNAVGDGLEGV